MKNDEFSVLVCGSQRFSDRAFVYGMLDALDERMKAGIEVIVTSRFSGACAFAKDWANEINSTNREKKVKVRECNLDNLLSERDGMLFNSDMYTLDKELLEHDPYFQNGKEKMIELGVKMVLAFPNDTGKLGVHTHNLVRFADLANLPSLNAEEAWKQIAIYKNGAKEAAQVENQPQPKGLKNSHPSKKF